MAVILYSQHSVYDIVHNFISMQSPIIDIFGLNAGTYIKVTKMNQVSFIRTILNIIGKDI